MRPRIRRALVTDRKNFRRPSKSLDASGGGEDFEHAMLAPPPGAPRMSYDAIYFYARYVMRIATHGAPPSPLEGEVDVQRDLCLATQALARG